MSALNRFAQEILEAAEQAKAAATTPQLGHSAMEGGHVNGYEANGGPLRTITGTLPDGTHGHMAVNGPAPKTPSAPTVDGIPRGFVVRWDGLDIDHSSVWPLDFSRVEVHASTEDVYDPDASTQIGTIETVRGGSVTHGLSASQFATTDTYYVKLVARNTSGAPSFPTASVMVVAEAAGSGGGGGSTGGELLSVSIGGGMSQASGANDGNPDGVVTQLLATSEDFQEVLDGAEPAPTYNGSGTGAVEGSWNINSTGLYRCETVVAIVDLYQIDDNPAAPEFAAVNWIHVDDYGHADTATTNKMFSFSPVVPAAGSQARAETVTTGHLYRYITASYVARLGLGDRIAPQISWYNDASGRLPSAPAPWALYQYTQITQLDSYPGPTV